MVKGMGTIPDKLRRAVSERDDYSCAVPRLTYHQGLDMDHTTGVKQGGPTEFYILVKAQSVLPIPERLRKRTVSVNADAPRKQSPRVVGLVSRRGEVNL